MDSREPSTARHHLLLFVFLSVLLVVAGAHLLESICYSVGLVDARPLVAGPNPQNETGNVERQLSPFHRAYRYIIALLLLFLGYQCYSVKEWARRLLVVILLVDLGVWIIHTVYFTLLTGQVRPAPSQVTVQVVAVLVESGLVWILTHPATMAYFVPQGGHRRSMPQ